MSRYRTNRPHLRHLVALLTFLPQELTEFRRARDNSRRSRRAAVWVWLSPAEMEGLTPEAAAHKAEFELGDDRVFDAPHRACKAAWAHAGGGR